jgi:solute carrier family 25 (mitochondrial phosphate transporter), member 23/24/25/41
MRVGPYTAPSYASPAAHHWFRQRLQAENLPFVYKFLAGSISGVVSTVFTYPLDVLRLRLALGSGWRNRRLATRRAVPRPDVVGIVPYAGTSWAVKTTLFQHFPDVFHNKPSVVESLLLHAVAG